MNRTGRKGNVPGTIAGATDGELEGCRPVGDEEIVNGAYSEVRRRVPAKAEGPRKSFSKTSLSMTRSVCWIERITSSTWENIRVLGAVFFEGRDSLASVMLFSF